MRSKCPPPERVHASEHLLHTGLTFSETVMVSVGVSKLSWTELFFCRAEGENKRFYYRDVLKQKLLPVIRQIPGTGMVATEQSRS